MTDKKIKELEIFLENFGDQDLNVIAIEFDSLLDAFKSSVNQTENKEIFVERLLRLVSDLTNATDNDQREHFKAQAKIEEWVTNYFESGSVKIELETCEICGAEIPDSADWCEEC